MISGINDNYERYIHSMDYAICRIGIYLLLVQECTEYGFMAISVLLSEILLNHVLEI